MSQRIQAWPGTGAAPPASRGRALLEEHFETVQRTLRRAAWLGRLPASEVEDFCAWATLKLVEDDSRMLALWQGKSSFPTYLRVVVQNLLRDYRIQLWGKWRPSKAATGLGRDALLLERLWVRDGLPLAEAIERMHRDHGVALATAELERIAGRLPRRLRRRRVGDERLLRMPVDGRVERGFDEEAAARVTARVREILPPLLRSLPEDGLRVLELHYRDGVSIADLASRLGRRQRELYSFRDRCLKILRRGMERAGLTSDQIGGLLAQSRAGAAPEGGIWE
jgi:DNA-directed RNA polymerase specialized sigma24 family protein